MADNRIPAPASGTLGHSPATSPSSQIQSAKARKSAYLCYFLAVLVMLVTAWFVVEGVQATEPASSARQAKIAAGVLLLVLEMCAFSLAGQWREFSPVLRALGWSIFVLQIVLMSLAQIAVGTTAAKSASLSTATVEEIRAQADASRQAAKSLMADAEKLRASKHAWVRQQAGEKSTAAAQQTAAGADAVAQLQQLQAISTSTPVLEMIGKPGLIALSIALSLILELAGITLMHTAGSLRRRADGALPVDVQILQLLHEVHGVPASAVGLQAVPVAPAPTPVSYRPVGTVAPAGTSTGLSYSGKVMLAGAGALAAVSAAPMAHAAPAVPAAGGVSKPIHAQDVQQASADASKAAPAAQETASDGVSETIQADVSKPIQQKTLKPRARRAVSAKLDTGTEGKAGARFKRVKAGVLAGKIRPSVRGIQAIEGGSQEVVADYLRQLENDGVIVRAGRGYAVAGKGGAA